MMTLGMAALGRDTNIKVQVLLQYCIILSVFFCSVSGRGILSGHADGTIVRFFFDDEGSGESQVSKILFQRAKFLFAQPASQLKSSGKGSGCGGSARLKRSCRLCLLAKVLGSIDGGRTVTRCFGIH